MFDFSLLGLAPGQCEVLVDAGANEGQFLFAALEALRPRRSVSIEMLQDLADTLRADPRLDPARNLVVHCALGDRPGAMPCLRSVYSQASSLLPLDPRAAEWYGLDLRQFPQGTVPVRTLDELCRSLSIDSIDLLKIDVQGYEKHLLAGAAEILDNTRNLIVELEFVPVYQGQALAAEIQALLEARGFRRRLHLAECHAADGRLLHADAWFQRRPSAMA